MNKEQIRKEITDILWTELWASETGTGVGVRGIGAATNSIMRLLDPLFKEGNKPQWMCINGPKSDHDTSKCCESESE